jgi:hypothetical protein
MMMINVTNVCPSDYPQDTYVELMDQLNNLDQQITLRQAVLTDDLAHSY